MTSDGKFTESDWEKWYAKWEQEIGQWLEEDHRPVTREDKIQTAWSFRLQRTARKAINAALDNHRDQFGDVETIQVVGEFLCEVGEESENAAGERLKVICRELIEIADEIAGSKTTSA